MRAFLKTVSSILLGLSAFVFVIAFIATFVTSSDAVAFSQSIAITSGAVTSLLLCGAVWLLADIAEAVNRKT